MSELSPLKLENAEFVVEVTEQDAGPDGLDAVTFMVSTNPGAPAGPINKIASGGELSRFLLALKVCLTKRAEGLSLIFDEIDQGIGGRIGDTVGRKLWGLTAVGDHRVRSDGPLGVGWRLAPGTGSLGFRWRHCGAHQRRCFGSRSGLPAGHLDRRFRHGLVLSREEHPGIAGTVSQRRALGRLGFLRSPHGGEREFFR